MGLLDGRPPDEGTPTRGIVWLGLFTFFGISTALVIGATIAFDGFGGFTDSHTSPFLDLFIILLASLSILFFTLWRRALKS
jgi:hypothetical protein